MTQIKLLGGKYKGWKLQNIPSGLDVRPILSLVKKSLFDILAQKIRNVRFLDLYAGAGTVGLEALSRGAKYAVFIDSNYQCINLIKQNVTRLGVSYCTKIYQAEILRGLDWLDDKFDIIFLGPPYEDKVVNRTLELIHIAKILSRKGWIIAQHHKKEQVNTKLFNLFRQKKYGDTIISFLCHKTK